MDLTPDGLLAVVLRFRCTSCWWTLHFCLFERERNETDEFGLEIGKQKFVAYDSRWTVGN